MSDDLARAVRIDDFPADVWVCEQHPDQPWPHANPNERDGLCAGPGMLRPTKAGAALDDEHGDRDDGREDQEQPSQFDFGGAGLAMMRSDAFQCLRNSVGEAYGNTPPCGDCKELWNGYGCGPESLDPHAHDGSDRVARPP